MLEQAIRNQYQKWIVDPLVVKIDKKFTPLQITGLSLLLGILIVPSLLLGHCYLAVLFLLASGYCDTLDGSLARYQNSASPIGSVMDIMVDRLVELAVIFSIYGLYPQERALGTILMLGSVVLCITSFLVVGIFSQNESDKSFHYSPGLMERAEAFCFFIIMILWPKTFQSLSILFSTLVCFTALIRIKQFIAAWK